MRINLPETNLVKTGRCLTTSENITTPVKHNPLVSWSRHRLGASNPRNQRKRTLRSRVSDTVRVPSAAKLLNVDRCSSRDGACNDRRSSTDVAQVRASHAGTGFPPGAFRSATSARGDMTKARNSAPISGIRLTTLAIDMRALSGLPSWVSRPWPRAGDHLPWGHCGGALKTCVTQGRRTCQHQPQSGPSRPFGLGAIDDLTTS